MKRISLVICVFNEEENIKPLAGQIIAALNNINFEAIFVDDGSTDKTRAILDRMAAQIPHLRVIHLAQNQGKAIALKTGAAAAKSGRC